MSIKLYANFLGRDSAITCSQSVDPDYPLTRLVDEKRDTAAKGLSASNQYIQFSIDLTAPPCDYFFIDQGHNLAGATVQLKGSATPGFESPDTIFTQVVSGDDAIFKYFTQETYKYYRLYLSNLGAAWSIFGVYFGKSQSLTKYPLAPARPDTIRTEKTVERYQTGRKKVTVHYTEHRIDYEWKRISPADWVFFAALEADTSYLSAPFWLIWEDQHAAPVLFISADDKLDWNYVDGVNRSVKLSAEEYL